MKGGECSSNQEASPHASIVRAAYQQFPLILATECFSIRLQQFVCLLLRAAAPCPSPGDVWHPVFVRA